MKVNIRADNSVEVEGYVNAIERNSKPLMSRIGRFIERICKGAFKKALERNDDVLMLLNHDPMRVLARTKDGTLQLAEDNIGLHARAIITDEDVVQKARNGDLVGWSFGFWDRDVEQGTEQGMPLRMVRDMDLEEVSVLDRAKNPAYDGTLVAVRDDGAVQYRGEAFIDDVNLSVDDINTDVDEKETKDEPELEHDPEANKPIDYSEWESMISEMKGEKS